MITKVIVRIDGSADLIVEGDGQRIDGTLAIECDIANQALIFEKIIHHALAPFSPHDSVALGAAIEDIPDNILRFAK